MKNIFNLRDTLEHRLRLRSIFISLSTHLKDKELVFVLNNQTDGQWYMFRSKTNKLHRTTTPPDKSPAFILCPPKSLYLALSNTSKEESAERWCCTFATPYIEIWEPTNQAAVMPLRMGLSISEKAFLLSLARAALEHKLTYGTTLPETTFYPYDTRLKQAASVDVAVWVDGYLRASTITYNKPLIGAIIDAATRASSDPRFKALEKNELAVARIEMVIFSDIVINLTPQERSENSIIYYHNGYLIEYGNKRNVYLPATHNCLPLGTNAHDLITHLGAQKTNLSLDQIAKASVSNFAVQDFIEDTKGSPLTLHGPTPAIHHCLNDDDTKSALQAACIQATKYLIGLQENSGYIKGIESIFKRTGPMSGWPRLAFTGFALSTWGRLTHDSEAMDAARKVYVYLSQNKENLLLSKQNLHYFYIYFGHLGQQINEENAVNSTLTYFGNNWSELNFDPILYSQVALFLIHSKQNDPWISKAITHLLSTLHMHFEESVRNNSAISLAGYAELLNPEINQHYTVTRTKFFENWYVQLQNPDGSFPDTQLRSFTYTRGTGKIFEVLSNSKTSQAAIMRKKAAAWLISHQYTNDSLYFIPQDLTSKLLGGFRHDYGNPDTHIDAAGHFIIGGARLLTPLNNS